MAHEVKFNFTILDDGAERIILFQMCENYTQFKIQGLKNKFYWNTAMLIHLCMATTDFVLWQGWIAVTDAICHNG